MVPGFGGNREAKEAVASEQRQFNFAERQNMVGVADGHPSEAKPLSYEAGRDSDLVRWQQDLEDELDKLRHDIRNEAKTSDDGGVWAPRLEVDGYDKKTGQPILVDMPPMMNEIGVQMIITKVKPLMSRNMINSNLDEDRILKMLKETSNSIVFNLANRFEEFGLGDAPSPSKLSQIMRITKNYIVPAPFRALNDGERRHLRTMNKRLETLSDIQGDSQQRKKLLGLI